MASTADLVTNSVPDLTKKDNEKTFRTKSFKERISYIREVITVEPLITAYIMASYLCQPALLNLEFEKACRANLNLNDTICDAILTGEHGNYTKENEEMQILISNMHSWQQPVQSFIPLILVLFLGSFSDRHKWRKPFLLLPIFGEFFSLIGCMLSVWFMRSWSLEVLGVVQTVVPSFFGGQTMMVMAVFAYIADVSTLEMRTLRIGVVQITLNVCSPIVQLFSGHLFNEIGYYGVFLIAAVFYGFGFVYGIFCIKEPKQPRKVSKGLLLRDMFDPRHAIDTFMLMLKKSPENNRTYIFLVLLTIFVYSGVASGEYGVVFLFAQSQFHWTIVEFSYLITLNTVVHLVGTIVGIPLFTKILNLSDPMILLITFADKILCNIIFGLATTDTYMYVAVSVSLITGVTAVAIRSLATKIVSENDLGKAQSLFSIFEAIAPAVAAPVYNLVIYNNTYNSFPTAFFFFGIILYVLTSIVITWMYINEKRKSRKVAREQKSKETNGSSLPMESYVQTTHI